MNTMRLFCLIVLSCLLSAGTSAAEQNAQSWEPGRAEPHSAVEAQSFHLAWGDGEEERSYIVIEPGDGLRRPALVATLDTQTLRMRVSYAGTAFIDQQGNIHIDAQRARIFGPDRMRWSPDSFKISRDGRVQWMDDARRNGGGRVIGWAPWGPVQKGVPLAFIKCRGEYNYRLMRLRNHFYIDGVL